MIDKPDQKKSKFDEEDLPKILTAIQKARKSGVPSSLLIEFADNGGVISAMLTLKERVK